MDNILKELSEVWTSVDEANLTKIIAEIGSKNRKIIGLGAGRMGYSLQAFIMRLSHLGYNAFMLGDTTLPRIGNNDLVIVNSSSGETQTIVLLAQIAKNSGAEILLISARKQSALMELADASITYKVDDTKQIMKTVYEQFTFLLFDFIADKLSSISSLSIDEIERNHSILE